jgi:A/G-specific adenine glycosylase
MRRQRWCISKPKPRHSWTPLEPVHFEGRRPNHSRHARQRADVSTGRPAARGAFADTLIRWHAQHGRHDLPWQGTRDPYRVHVSEVMLQQTQVATVRDYYARFLQRFPDVQTLAAAPLDDVLAHWSGLGYYSRARCLHRCAQQVVAAHAGAYPRSSQALLTLPGIGRSTAAAIAAFCFDERAAILDGNVKRVLTRWLGFGADLAESAHEKSLWLQAEALLPERGVAIYTQALMDLGATLCLARQPQCPRCPAAPSCVALRQGRTQDYPVKSRKLQRGRRSHSLLWLQRGEQLLLTQRPATGVWAGLWSLPEFDSETALLEATRGWPGQASWLPNFQHTLTHFDWSLTPCQWRLPTRLSAARLSIIEAALPPGAQRWVTPDDALRLGLPAPIRKLIEAG